MKRKCIFLLVIEISLILLAACSPATVSVTPEPVTPNIPIPRLTDTAIPCLAIFTPVGFLSDNNHLLGKQIIEGQKAFRLQILDLQNLQVETIYEYSPAQLDWPVLSPDGKLVAVPQPDYSVRLIRLADGAMQTTLVGHTNFISAMVFSPAGDKLYTGSMDAFVRVWDLSGNLLSAFQPDGADNLPSEITGLGVSPDGKVLVTIPLEGRIKAWDTTGFTKLAEYEGPIFGSYNGSTALFSPDGRHLAVGLAAGPGAVSLWRISDGALLWRGGSFAFAFSPDGKAFAHTDVGEGAEFSEQIVLSSGDGQTPLITLDETYLTAIQRLMFSPDGTKLAVFTASAQTQIWNTANGRKLLIYQAVCS